MGLVMRPWRRRLLRAGAGLFLWAGLAGTSVLAEPSLTVRGVQVVPAGDGARVIVELSREANATPLMLGAPQPRFVVDLPSATWAAPRMAAGKLVRGIRHGDREGQTRLVLDLSSELRVARMEKARAGGRFQLIYDLAPVGNATPTMLEKPVTFEPVAPPQPVAPQPRKQRTIVVDAGHGGKDSGALGKSLGREKDYNLAAALDLRTALQKRGYRVVMTRQTDVFLPLAERVKIAREAKADLFISVHSDADPKGQAKGATVYTLSQRGNQRARAIMDGQDWNVDLGPARPSFGVSNILLDLTQRETNGNSADFAEDVLSRLSGLAPLTSKTPKRAGFFVLLAPDVPAVLLEMGYVTHPTDEKRLASASQRRTLMDAMAASVDDYFQARKTYASAAR
jgi:N-acetylmuramoyl-L-alanine amidase